MKARRQKLIDPRLQSKFILAFASVAACCVLLQAVSSVVSLHGLADRLPHDGPVVLREMQYTTFVAVGLSFLFLVPLSIAVALVLTHRIAGPLYSMRRYLERLERGEPAEACRIRKGDELQDFCDLLNRATAIQRPALERMRAVASAPEPEAALPSSAAADSEAEAAQRESA